MDELDALIGAWTVTMPADALLDVLADAGVPAGQIFTAPHMLNDEHYLARDMVVRKPNRFDVDIPMTGVVPKFERTPGSIDATGPLLGEHSEVVLRELVGLDAGEFDTLVARGVVGVTVGS